MSLFKEIKTLIHQCLTNPQGVYDPARVAGYGIVVLGGLQYLVLSAYMAIKNGEFDGLNFATGLAAIGAALMAAAGGVWIKKVSEPSSESK